MNTIPKSFESIKQVMKACIEKEIQENGLLADVNTFVPIYYNESVLNEPVIWMTQHPSRVEKTADISQTMDILTPFEFDCAVYAPDLEDADTASQNLAFNVVLAITKNYLQVQKELFDKRIILRIDFETYSPVGQVPINGKSDRIPATGVILNVIHRINWINCCKNTGD